MSAGDHGLTHSEMCCRNVNYKIFFIFPNNCSCKYNNKNSKYIGIDDVKYMWTWCTPRWAENQEQNQVRVRQNWVKMAKTPKAGKLFFKLFVWYSPNSRTAILKVYFWQTSAQCCAWYTANKARAKFSYNICQAHRTQQEQPQQ